eukprot:symbB.v1.2.033436.t1/scaffold4152.1/size43796/3
MIPVCSVSPVFRFCPAQWKPLVRGGVCPLAPRGDVDTDMKKLLNNGCGRARAQRRECATGKLVKLQPKKARPFDRVMSLVCREAGLAINGQSRPAVKMALRLLHLGRCFGLRYPQGQEEIFQRGGNASNPIAVLDSQHPSHENRSHRNQTMGFGDWSDSICLLRIWLLELVPAEVSTCKESVSFREESIPATLRTKHCWATAVCAAVIGISVGEEVHCSSSNSAQFAKAEKWKALAEGVRSAVEEALLSALKTLPFGAHVQKEELCLFIKSLLEFYPELLNAAPAGEGRWFPFEIDGPCFALCVIGCSVNIYGSPRGFKNNHGTSESLWIQQPQRGPQVVDRLVL